MKDIKDHHHTPQFRIEDINNYFGDIDLFLLDLLLKETIVPGRLLDIGFGTGRNMIHFLQREEFEVYGIETDRSCISLVQMMVPSFSNQEASRFLFAPANHIPFEKNFFQTVVCARVFHFLNDQEKLEAWEAIHDILVPGGLLYLTTNSTINFEKRSKPGKENQRTFPDGTTGHFLAENQLHRMIGDLRFEKIEPVRNVQYDDQHAETILVLRKK